MASKRRTKTNRPTVDLGGKKLEGPEICKGYSPGYYAFFFEDPDGNKLEICCREKPVFDS